MSDTDLPFELLATNASVIVRLMLPGDVPYEAEFSLSPAGITSVSAELLLAGGLRVCIVHNGVSITRIIPSGLLPAYEQDAG